MELREFFREHPRAALAFSGGVESFPPLTATVLTGRSPQMKEAAPQPSRSAVY